MSCAHCVFDAKRRGEGMSLDVYIRALQLVNYHGMDLTIGGGEPTVHPQFKLMIERLVQMQRMGAFDDSGIPPLIVTNGKLKTKAHWLLDLVEDHQAELNIELSQDDFHDPIDPRVVSRFQWNNKNRGDTRLHGTDAAIGVRTNNDNLLPFGRAADRARGLHVNRSRECCCETLFIVPNGDIYSCGCKHTKLGTVYDADLYLSWYSWDYAHTGGREPEYEAVIHEWPQQATGLIGEGLQL